MVILWIFLIPFIIMCFIIFAEKTFAGQLVWNFLFQHKKVYLTYKQLLNSDFSIPVFSFYLDKKGDWQFATEEMKQKVTNIVSNYPFLMQFGSDQILATRNSIGGYKTLLTDLPCENLLLKDVLNNHNLVYFE